METNGNIKSEPARERRKKRAKNGEKCGEAVGSESVRSSCSSNMGTTNKVPLLELHRMFALIINSNAFIYFTRYFAYSC